MSNWIKCDVEDCGTMDEVNNSQSLGSWLPPGWRIVEETRTAEPMPVPEVSSFERTLGNAMGEKLGLPQALMDEVMQQRVQAHPAAFSITARFHVCPFHKLPRMRAIPGMPPAGPEFGEES